MQSQTEIRDDRPTTTEDGGNGDVVDPAMVVELHREHFGALVRLAQRLLDDRSTCEEVVQDAFLALFEGRARPRPGSEASYLRSMVMNAARSRLRHRQVQERHAPEARPPTPAAEDDALGRCDRDRLLGAIAELPRRQGQVLTLRFYRDLSEAEIAITLSISRGSVKTHASRGLRALGDVLTGEAA